MSKPISFRQSLYELLWNRGITTSKFEAITDSEDGVVCDHLIEVSPVRHGHWISLTECANEGVYCSICKKKVWKSDYAWCSKKSRNKLRSNYCPNCGATMDLHDVER